MKTENLRLPGLLLANLVSVLPLAATSPEVNPYGLISQKNTFRLLQIPEVTIENPRPFAKLALQGLTTVLGYPQVLIKVVPPGNASGASGEVSLILGVGEAVGSIEVLEIDNSARVVRVLNYGIRQELSL
jgi:hypothetical protein